LKSGAGYPLDILLRCARFSFLCPRPISRSLTPRHARRVRRVARLSGEPLSRRHSVSADPSTTLPAAGRFRDCSAGPSAAGPSPRPKHLRPGIAGVTDRSGGGCLGHVQMAHSRRSRGGRAGRQGLARRSHGGKIEDRHPVPSILRGREHPLFGRSRPPIEEALDALTDLFSIPLEVVPPAMVSATATLRQASLDALSYYDATYVALAEMLDCPLITSDRRLAQRARDTGRARLLGAV